MWFFVALRHVLSVTPRARRVFSGVRGNNADCRIISVVGLGSRLSPLPLVCDGLLVPQSLSLLLVAGIVVRNQRIQAERGGKLGQDIHTQTPPPASAAGAAALP